MYLQVITALGSLIGCSISLLVGGDDPAATSWIVPFTAGGLIYLGCRSIPELLEGSNLMQSLSEMITILLTVYTMFLVNTS